MFFPWNRLSAQIMPRVVRKDLKSEQKKCRTVHLEHPTEQGRVDDSNSIPSNEAVLRSSRLKKPEADLRDCVGCFGNSDVTARPGSRRPARAEPCEAKLYEAPTGLPGAHGSGFTFLKPQAVA